MDVQVNMNAEVMKNLIIDIKESYGLTAIPVRIKNEKRWESMDEIIEREPFEGVPQRLAVGNGFGVIIYDWDTISEDTLNSIITTYNQLKSAKN